MTGCCARHGQEELFTAKGAERAAKRYRRRGPDPMARSLARRAAERGVEGATVLEIGGGVGEVLLELLKRGAERGAVVELVPAYEPCTAPNRTHGPPLAFPSCNPPSEASDYVTVGTPDANGAPPNFAGFLKLRALVGAPGPPDDSDVIFAASITDVRCKAGTSACGNSNAAGGPDYTGELQANATIRITDHWNATSAGGGSDPATVVDIPMPINLTCVSTADTSMGANCNISGNTCLGCLEPVIRDGKRTVVEIGQVRVTDGGGDGVVASAPNTLFAIQGIFIP